MRTTARCGLWAAAALVAAPLHAQEGAGAPAELRAAAESAMAEGQWEAAAIKLRRMLGNADLASEERAAAEARLVEALDRLERPAAALAAADAARAPSAELAFWRARALIALGRYAPAETALQPLAADAKEPRQADAALARAGLLFALAAADVERGDPDAAAARRTAANNQLRDLIEARGAHAGAASLLLAETMLDDDLPAEARSALDAADALPAAAAPGPLALAGARARLALAEGDPAKALAALPAEIALEQPYADRAALLQAHALLQLDRAEEARARLLALIQRRPDSAALGEAFDLLGAERAQTPPATRQALDSLAAETTGDRAALAAYHLARIARAEGDYAASEAALQRFLGGFRGHYLRRRALVELAESRLDGGDPSGAASALRALRSSAALNADLTARLNFLDARIAHDQGRARSASAALAAISQEAEGPELRLAAAMNSAIAAIRSDDAALERARADALRAAAAASGAIEPLDWPLASALHLAAVGDPRAEPRLRTLLEAPEPHVRAAEIRLALAELAQIGRAHV